MSTVITKDEARQNISANLIRLLGDRGMSQPKLAAMTGIPVMTINNAVRGVHVLSAVHLARIAEAFDVSMDRLMSPPANGLPLVATRALRENFSAPA